MRVPRDARANARSDLAGTAETPVRKTNVTGVIPTFTGALRVTDMVATLRH